MLNLISGLPSNVIGFEAVGEVHAEDYKTVLHPAMDAALAEHRKIRMLYVLGEDFHGYSGGALWQDAKLGVSGWSSWDRIALVTDHKAYADGVKAFAGLIPGEVKVYPLSERTTATAWVSA